MAGSIAVAGDRAAPRVVARAASAEQLAFPDGSTMTLLADSRATGGKLSVHHTVLRHGANGASPHHHTLVAEAFYVLRGTVQLLAADELIEIGAGDLAVVPPGVAHAFAAAPGEDAELLVAVTPGIERFDLFRRVVRVMAGREPAGSAFADQSGYDTYPDHSEIWDQTRQPALTTKEPS
jgi:mannose-6-phosphate isomerase-like protein (cupin superfamily)